MKILLFLFLNVITVFGDAATDRRCVEDVARSLKGKPYVAGAQGPDSFDAVGLVMYCYEQCGHGFSTKQTVASLKAGGEEEIHIIFFLLVILFFHQKIMFKFIQVEIL